MHLKNRLSQIFVGCKKLLIVLHDNPDPDAIAGGLASGYFIIKII